MSSYLRWVKSFFHFHLEQILVLIPLSIPIGHSGPIWSFAKPWVASAHSQSSQIPHSDHQLLHLPLPSWSPPEMPWPHQDLVFQLHSLPRVWYWNRPRNRLILSISCLLDAWHWLVLSVAHFVYQFFQGQEQSWPDLLGPGSSTEICLANYWLVEIFYVYLVLIVTFGEIALYWSDCLSGAHQKTSFEDRLPRIWRLLFKLLNFSMAALRSLIARW